MGQSYEGVSEGVSPRIMTIVMNGSEMTNDVFSFPDRSRQRQFVDIHTGGPYLSHPPSCDRAMKSILSLLKAFSLHSLWERLLKRAVTLKK